MSWELTSDVSLHMLSEAKLSFMNGPLKVHDFDTLGGEKTRQPTIQNYHMGHLPDSALTELGLGLGLVKTYHD